MEELMKACDEYLAIINNSLGGEHFDFIINIMLISDEQNKDHD